MHCRADRVVICSVHVDVVAFDQALRELAQEQGVTLSGSVCNKCAGGGIGLVAVLVAVFHPTYLYLCDVTDMASTVLTIFVHATSHHAQHTRIMYNESVQCTHQCVGAMSTGRQRRGIAGEHQGARAG